MIIHLTDRLMDHSGAACAFAAQDPSPWRWTVRITALALLALCPLRVWPPLVAHYVTAGIRCHFFTNLKQDGEESSVPPRVKAVFALVHVIAWVACVILAQIHPLYGLAAGTAVGLIDLAFFCHQVDPVTQTRDFWPF